MPVFVLYNIPDRDLGEYSAGGLSTADAYREWARTISTGIGENNAVLVVEPDALAGIPEMSPSEGQARADLLRSTLEIFQQNNPNAKVYLDAGHDAWLTAQEAADLLHLVDGGTGFVDAISLNVSNYGTIDNVSAYANEIIAALGEPIKVLSDPGRGGKGGIDRERWCNNSNAKIGSAPDYEFNFDNTIEFIIVKPPGESDGLGVKCGKFSPIAGEFSSRLLAQLIRN
jgi:endoglucanase